MSFGFSIGDFIAVGELAHRLWRDVYVVARKAPYEIRELTKELNTLSSSIKLLTEEAQDPESTLVQSGADRVNMVNEIMSAIKETLTQLDKYVQRHGIVMNPNANRPKMQRVFDKLKIVKDARSINDLRVKVNYHCSILQLLLTSVGNSSLEKLHQENKTIARNQEIVLEMLRDADRLGKASVSSALTIPDVPMLSTLDRSDAFHSLSESFLHKVERLGSWLEIGIDVWIKIGQQWLAISRYHRARYQWLCDGSAATEEGKAAEVQSHADLLKAWWIVVDIVSRHPQRPYVSAKVSNGPILELATEVSADMEVTKQLGRLPNNLTNIFQDADHTILLSSSGSIADIQASLLKQPMFLKRLPQNSHIQLSTEGTIEERDEKRRSQLENPSDCVVLLVSNPEDISLELQIYDARGCGFILYLQNSFENYHRSLGSPKSVWLLSGHPKFPCRFSTRIRPYGIPVHQEVELVAPDNLYAEVLEQDCMPSIVVFEDPCRHFNLLLHFPDTRAKFKVLEHIDLAIFEQLMVRGKNQLLLFDLHWNLSSAFFGYSIRDLKRTAPVSIIDCKVDLILQIWEQCDLFVCIALRNEAGYEAYSSYMGTVMDLVRDQPLPDFALSRLSRRIRDQQYLPGIILTTSMSFGVCDSLVPSQPAEATASAFLILLWFRQQWAGLKRTTFQSEDIDLLCAHLYTFRHALYTTLRACNFDEFDLWKPDNVDNLTRYEWGAYWCTSHVGTHLHGDVLDCLKAGLRLHHPINIADNLKLCNKQELITYSDWDYAYRGPRRGYPCSSTCPTQALTAQATDDNCTVRWSSLDMCRLTCPEKLPYTLEAVGMDLAEIKMKLNDYESKPETQRTDTSTISEPEPANRSQREKSIVICDWVVNDKGVLSWRDEAFHQTTFDVCVFDFSSLDRQKRATPKAQSRKTHRATANSKVRDWLQT